MLKVRFFSFVDSVQEAFQFQKAGFKVVIDDAINEIFYAEMVIESFDSVTILALMEDFKNHWNINPIVDWEGEYYSFELAMKKVDGMGVES